MATEHGGCALEETWLELVVALSENEPLIRDADELQVGRVEFAPHTKHHHDGLPETPFFDRVREAEEKAREVALARPSGLRFREGDQQLPEVNEEEFIQDLVIADIEERRQLGIKRYGTALQPFNGRDALQDAYEEAIDLCMYLKQAIVERDSRGEDGFETEPES